MVAQGRRADARLLSRGRCAWSSLLDIPPWALQQRSSESPLVYAWGVRMNNQCAAPSSMGNEPIFADLAATTNYSFLDRKSAVSGTSVSVRVDLDVRRL